jgi:hypothetical protein
VPVPDHDPCSAVNGPSEGSAKAGKDTRASPAEITIAKTERTTTARVQRDPDRSDLFFILYPP